jgi:ubiquitin carboxyl-terminal hydrolase 7
VYVERRFVEERRLQEAKQRERDELYLFLTAKVITDETFQAHQGFDLATFDDKYWPPTELYTFRVLKTEPYLKFKSRVAQYFKKPESQFRLWALHIRQNKTVRPAARIPETEPGLSEF